MLQVHGITTNTPVTFFRGSAHTLHCDCAVLCIRLLLYDFRVLYARVVFPKEGSKYLPGSSWRRRESTCSGVRRARSRGITRSSSGNGAKRADRDRRGGEARNLLQAIFYMLRNNEPFRIETKGSAADFGKKHAAETATFRFERSAIQGQRRASHSAAKDRE